MSKPTQHLPELTVTMEASPSHVLGALKEDLSVLGAYLNQNAPLNINAPECKKHLLKMIEMLGHLHVMQTTFQAAQANGGGAEARKN